MTVKGFMETSLMKGAELVAGEKGLNSEVVAAIPSSVLEFDKWIIPGMVLLVPGSKDTNLRSSKEAIHSALCEGALAAILVFGPREDDYILNETLDFYEEHNLPLFFLPKQTNMMIFYEGFMHLFVTFNSKTMRSESLLLEICLFDRKNLGSDTSFHLHYNPSYNYNCVLCKIHKKNMYDSPIQIDQTLIKLRNTFENQLYSQEVSVISCISGNQLILFYPTNKEGYTKGFIHRTVEGLAPTLKNIADSFKLLITVGSVAKSISEFHTSYINALETQETVIALESNHMISYYEDWYTHIAILSKPRDELKKQMLISLEPILTQPELIETLATYLTYGKNMKFTADKLYIHVNTLHYRLNRISELLECDLEDSRTRFRLQIAITIERFLRNTEGCPQ